MKQLNVSEETEEHQKTNDTQKRTKNNSKQLIWGN